MTSNNQLLNFINGTWTRSAAGEALNIMNPATAQVLTTVPLSPGAGGGRGGVQVAQTALVDWRHTPVVDRIQPLFRLKMLLEEHIEEIARHH
ncbi:MAG: aldehyde dehydrogenase family protein [Caldilineaceae bacterium]